MGRPGCPKAANQLRKPWIKLGIDANDGQSSIWILAIAHAPDALVSAGCSTRPVEVIAPGQYAKRLAASILEQ
jgi:hypothetical protein